MPDLILPPRAVDAGTPPDVRRNVRVVDATTGETIAAVISADADAGTVSRFAVEDGNLVRQDDAFVVIDEARAIEIEWIEAPAIAETADAEVAG